MTLPSCAVHCTRSGQPLFAEFCGTAGAFQMGSQNCGLAQDTGTTFSPADGLKLAHSLDELPSALVMVMISVQGRGLR